MGRQSTRQPKPDSVARTGDPLLDLLIAICKQATKDSKRDERAQWWLDEFLGDLWDDSRRIPSKRQCRRR